MSLPFSTEERYAEARQRSLSRRSRKARALIASGHEPYVRLGQSISKDEAAAEDDARHEVQRAFDEQLRADQLARENARDLAAARYHKEQMTAAAQRHQEDLSFKREEFELKKRELGLDQPVGPPAKTVMGMDIPPGLPPKAPVHKQKEVDDARQNIAQLNDAWKMLERAPGTYGGTANRVAGYLQAPISRIPGIGPAVESATSALTLTPDEREARHHIAGLVDEVIKRTSGAQVSLQEELRKSYLPKPYESMDQVREKVRSLLLRNINNYHTMGGLGEVGLPSVQSVDNLVDKWNAPPPPLLRRPQ